MHWRLVVCIENLMLIISMEHAAIVSVAAGNVWFRGC